jgi:hypothetical protein
MFDSFSAAPGGGDHWNVARMQWLEALWVFPPLRGRGLFKKCQRLETEALDGVALVPLVSRVDSRSLQRTG